jgi:hypothetical protein
MNDGQIAVTGRLLSSSLREFSFICSSQGLETLRVGLMVRCKTTDQKGQIRHCLAPAPCASLSTIVLCPKSELNQFINIGTSYIVFLLRPDLGISLEAVLGWHLRTLYQNENSSWLNCYLEDLADYLIDTPSLALELFLRIEQLIEVTP